MLTAEEIAEEMRMIVAESNCPKKEAFFRPISQEEYDKQIAEAVRLKAEESEPKQLSDLLKS